VNNSGHGNLLVERSTSDNQAHGGGVYSAGASVWELGRIALYDGGPDSDAETTADNNLIDSTTDNRLFATQGVFVP
jgi:hypothetical protein